VPVGAVAPAQCSGASASHRAWILGIALALSLLAGHAHAGQAITALAPTEVFADGFRELRGVVVDAQGNVVVADRDAGTLTRLAPNGARAVVASGLERPIGLAFDPVGRLLVAEEKAGRVVRVEAGGRLRPVLVGVKQPRWLAVREDGTLFVSARRLTRDRDAERDDESAEPEMIVALSPAGRLTVFADGFTGLQGLTLNHATLFAATQGRRGDRHAEGVVFQIPILADGSAGPAAALGPTDELKKPVGLARDRLGSLYLTTQERGLAEDPARRGIAKLHADARLTLFATSLKAPQGLAFDAGGHLYVADGKRVLRFVAPPAPSVSTTLFTNRSPLAVTGTAHAGAAVDLFVNDAATPVRVIADPTGAFAAQLALALNSRNTLEVFATDHGGDGLASPPAEATVVHDSIPPARSFQAPAGAHVRLIVSVQAQASDGGSGVATLGLTLDGQALPSTVAPLLPAASATASAAWQTTAVADGSHTLGVAATDRAGNTAFAARAVIVDNTPPTAQLTGGPAGTVQGTTATFTFTGADNLTAPDRLQFAWRLDGGAFTAFADATSAAFSNLAAGAHTFEVRARDLAGNESAAAQRSFTVSALRVTITDPANGGSVPTGLLLVRGMIDAGGAEVGVTVNAIPAVVQGTTFVALVPIGSDTTTLTAVASLASGVTATHAVSVSVAAASGAAAPTLLVSPQNGSAPLRVTFSMIGAVLGTIVLDADGDGVIDVTGPSLDGQSFTYSRPGLYVPTAIVTDLEGRQVAARAVVQVYDVAALDALLQSKWRGLKDALRAGDVPGAVRYIVAESRDEYQTAFQMIAASLPAIDGILTDLTLVRIRDGTALYQATRTDAGLAKVFDVRFAVDEDGLWRVERF